MIDSFHCNSCIEAMEQVEKGASFKNHSMRVYHKHIKNVLHV